MTSNLKALEQRQAGAEDEGNTNATTKSLQPLQCPVCIDPQQDLPEGKEVKGTQCGHLFYIVISLNIVCSLNIVL